MEFASFAGIADPPDNKMRSSIKVWPMPGRASTPRAGIRQALSSGGNEARPPQSSSGITTGSPPTTSPDSRKSDRLGPEPRLTITLDKWATRLTYSPDGKSIVAGVYSDEKDKHGLAIRLLKFSSSMRRPGNFGTRGTCPTTPRSAIVPSVPMERWHSVWTELIC